MMLYITKADANEWLEDRGYSPVEDEQLRAAQDYLDAVYGHLFVGVPSGDDAWPRDGATDCHGNDLTGIIPDAVKHALALIASSGVYQSSLPVISGASSVREGALAVTFGAGARQSGKPDGFLTNPLVDAMLACLIEPRIPVRLV